MGLGTSNQKALFQLGSFCLFSSFSQYNDKYKYNRLYMEKHRWCALGLNPGWQDGRRRRIH